MKDVITEGDQSIKLGINRTIQELKVFLSVYPRQDYRGINRTIQELKVRRSDSLNKVLAWYQSHHIGIEMAKEFILGADVKLYQSHHIGIEIFRHTSNSQTFSGINRTRQELKSFFAKYDFYCFVSINRTRQELNLYPTIANRAYNNRVSIAPYWH